MVQALPVFMMIEVAKKSFDHREIQKATAAIKAGQWSSGKRVTEFEHRFAKYLNQKFCVTTNSGSSANLLAITALTSPRLGDSRLKSGDEVITVAAGFPTTINPIIQNRFVPVFIDIDLITLNIQSQLLTKALSRKTKAVFLAHTLGIPFDVAGIKKFCRTHKLFLIEDNCDGLGSTYKGKLTGTFGDLATYSFYPAHHMTMGEGGAVATNNPKLAKVLFALRDWGRYLDEPQPHTGNLPADYDQRYIFYEMGYNFKITEMQAAIGLAQLQKLPRFTAERIINGNYLMQELTNLPGLIIHHPPSHSQPSWFGFPITIDPKAPFTRQDFVKFLHQHKIDTRLLLAGNVTKQPYFLSLKPKYRTVGALTNTNIVANQTLWIGCNPQVTKPQLQYIVASIKQFLSRHD